MTNRGDSRKFHVKENRNLIGGMAKKREKKMERGH